MSTILRSMFRSYDAPGLLFTLTLVARLSVPLVALPTTPTPSLSPTPTCTPAAPLASAQPEAYPNPAHSGETVFLRNGAYAEMFQWTQTGGPTVPLNANTYSDEATIVAPLVAEPTTLTFRLVASSNGGGCNTPPSSDTAYISVMILPPLTPTPTPTHSPTPTPTSPPTPTATATPPTALACGDPIVAQEFAACRTALTESDCTRTGGRWGFNWDSGHRCFCPTGQAGCVCSGPAECLGSCYASLPAGFDCTMTQGTCTSEEPLVECWCVFDEDGHAAGLCNDPPSIPATPTPTGPPIPCVGDCD